MDKKFTPEEIVQSLRACSSKKFDCRGCIYEGKPAYCAMKLKGHAADTVEALIQENKRLREERRWIPVEERKPDEEYAAALAKGLDDVEVIATIENATESTALRYDGRVGVFFAVEAGDDGGELVLYRVTHWKPMPKGAEVSHD